MIDPIDIEELIGCAFQSNSLRMNPDAERALDRIAAFGMGTRRTTHRRPDRSPTDLDRVDAALGVALWHATHIDETATHAAEKLLELALLMRPYGPLAILKAEQDRVAPLAHRSIREWLHSKCGACAGSGYQEIVRQRRIRPRALMRNQTLAPCMACSGSGQARPDLNARRHALECDGETLSRETYLAKWEPVYRLALGLCDKATGGLRGPTWHALRGRAR